MLANSGGLPAPWRPVTLETGDVSESVTVMAETPLMDLTTAKIGAVVESRQILDLPLLGRNAMMLFYLAALQAIPSLPAGYRRKPEHLLHSSERRFVGRVITGAKHIPGVPHRRLELALQRLGGRAQLGRRILSPGNRARLRPHHDLSSAL